MATALVGVLGVLVVVLAFSDRSGKGDSVPRAELTALQTKVDTIDERLTSLQTALRDLARQTVTSLDKAAADRKQNSARQLLVGRCLTQLQAEVDDIVRYLAYGPPPRGNRVSGRCVQLLQPRAR